MSEKMRWRWDQGRLPYFQYDNLVRIAEVLTSLNGVKINQKGVDPLRTPLENGVGLPFSPSHYRVWRNYARVFECALLATSVGGNLYTTDFCKLLMLPADKFSPDQYFNLLFSRFSYPSCLFENYNITQKQVFPFIAMIKFAMTRGNKGISLGEVFSYVVGNGCTGLEGLDFYSKLSPTGRLPLGDEKRQVREMLRIMGQSSYLKWFSSRLYVDTADYDAVLRSLVPFVRIKRCADTTEEFCRITTIDPKLDLGQFDIEFTPNEEMKFEFSVAEGGRAFATHGRIERSPMVRKMYFKVHPSLICDACHLDVRQKYPWTQDKNILELHHVLPLAATLLVNGTTTRLDDMVPLCPNCHKSIHIFYKKELDRLGVKDFTTKDLAHETYDKAKFQIAS